MTTTNLEGAIWFAPWTRDLEYIGIVKIRTDKGYKYKIGTAEDNDLEGIKKIMEAGDEFNPEIFKDF